MLVIKMKKLLLATLSWWEKYLDDNNDRGGGDRIDRKVQKANNFLFILKKETIFSLSL